MNRTVTTLKNTLLIATIALAALAGTSASAQNKAFVTVPFAFTANHDALPAGRYEVLSSDTSLTFINPSTGHAQAILLTRHEAGDAIETQGSLCFQVTGSRYVLIEVRFAGSSTHSKLLTKPKQEGSVGRSGETATALVEVPMK